MIKPPIAKKIPHQTEIHNDIRIDDYHWLRDDKSPDVSVEILNHLKSENAYEQQEHQKFQVIEDQLFEEMKAKIVENDISYPVKIKEYQYFYKTVAGQNHPIYYRKSAAGEQLILDPNELAKNSKSFSLMALSNSHNQNLLAFSFDMIGKERYQIKVRDLETMLDHDDLIENVHGDEIIWDKKDEGFFYLKLDENWKLNKLFYHKLGTNQDQDRLVFHETNPVFILSIKSSSSEKYLILYSGSYTAQAGYYLDLATPLAPLREIYPIANNHLISIDHQDNYFYMTINDNGSNFRLVKFPVDNLDQKSWQEIISQTELGYITDFYTLKDYLVVTAKHQGLSNIYIYQNDKLYSKVPFTEQNYEISTQFTEYDSDFVRINYSSMITPPSVEEYNLTELKLYTRKVKKIPGYDSTRYDSKRIFVTSRDGVKIPVSMVYRKDVIANLEPKKMLLYGYGSYGIGMDADFSANVFSLLDRGYIYAIAHIRGGDEMGFDWYESAKFLNKKRTFDDFIDVTKYLISNKYTASDRLAIMGGSAGGMLVGNVINEHPELFKSALALVPFVDVLNTMLDESLTLTPGEFKEWGNPKDEEYYHYIKSYSPYDNIKHHTYPNMLVTAGINDPRVTYWEPAKWVAKLREYKTDNNLLLFKTELEQGHKGVSGRYDRIREVASYFAFTIYSVEH